MIEINNQFARDEIERFAYQHWDLNDFMTDANPYCNDRHPRINNRKMVIESVEFENIVISRKLKIGTEIQWANEAKERTQKLYNSIESYLNASNN